MFTPVKFTGVYDDAGDGGAVAADPFCCGVGDDICAVLDRTDKETPSAEGVIDDNRDSGIVCYLHNGLKVRDIVFRISDRLDIDCLRPVIDSSGDILWLIAVDEFRLDPETGKEDFELVVCAAVEVAGGDDVVPCVREGCNRHELRRLAGGGGNGGDTTFEGSDPFLENVHRGVHYPGVDVAELFEPKEACAMGRVVEDEGLGGGGLDIGLERGIEGIELTVEA